MIPRAAIFLTSTISLLLHLYGPILLKIVVFCFSHCSKQSLFLLEVKSQNPENKVAEATMVKGSNGFSLDPFSG